MKHAPLALLAVLGLTACAAAAPPGFLTDFEQAKTEARESGKHVFTYFNLRG